jgi:hypothetical protein
VIDALEDAEDYSAFEMSVTADYDAQTVEPELVLRLANLRGRVAERQSRVASSKSRHSTNGNFSDRLTKNDLELSTKSSDLPRSRGRHRAG